MEREFLELGFFSSSSLVFFFFVCVTFNFSFRDENPTPEIRLWALWARVGSVISATDWSQLQSGPGPVQLGMRSFVWLSSYIMLLHFINTLNNKKIELLYV